MRYTNNLTPVIDPDPTLELGRNSDYERACALLSEREEWADYMNTPIESPFEEDDFNLQLNIKSC